MRLYKANRLLTFAEAYRTMKSDILYSPFVTTGQWQSQATDMKTRELMGAVLEYVVPPAPHQLEQELVGVGLPWAEDHFRERVGGEPLNPPPSEAWWPHNVDKNAAHKFSKDGEAQQFSHTYPERFWPRFANVGETRPNGRQVFVPHNGIRFEYGDLGSVVDLLRRAPGSRQAYLPVWFPEDTGTVHGERVPCTLGYHFLIRGDQLHCWYSMRSCDLIRHFPDDVYMACRLMQWMCAQLCNTVKGLRPGVLTMTMSSLHTFESDDYTLRRETSLAGGL